MPPDVNNNIPEMKLYCYSIEGFKKAMEQMGYGRNDEKILEKDNIAVISICCTDTSPEEYKGMFSEEHYFYNKSNSKNVLNIRFDDIDPRLWHGHDFDLDNASEDDFLYDLKDKKTSPKALGWKQAQEIVAFVVKNLGNDFYIHCSAGVSRSQAIVKFILDSFSFPGNKKFNYKILPENPPVQPNIHVLTMLKRTISKEILYRIWVASHNPRIDVSLFGKKVRENWKNGKTGRVVDAFEDEDQRIWYQVEHDEECTIKNCQKDELEIL
jgi:predicted protein tyrosine phosphatase